MILQRRFAPIGVRNEPESVAGFTGIYSYIFRYSPTLSDPPF